MVKYGSMDLNQALETVKQKREKVNPNEGNNISSDYLNANLLKRNFGASQKV